MILSTSMSVLHDLTVPVQVSDSIGLALGNGGGGGPP